MSVTLLLGTLPAMPFFTVSAATPTALSDDFSDGNYTSNPVWNVVSGNWSVAADPADPTNQVLMHTYNSGAGIISTGDPSWTDYTVSMRIKAASGAYPGILARFKDNKNYYYFQISQPTNTLVLSKTVNGTATTLKTVPFTTTANKWYTLKMVLIGNSIRCYAVVNGVDQFIADYTDTTFTSGMVAIRNNWANAYVDDVNVTNIPKACDTTISSYTSNSSSVTLNWDAASGATSYNIYRSTTSGSGYILAGSTAGTSFTDTGLVMLTNYYYKLAYVYGGPAETQWSAEFQAKTDLGIPATPAGLTATPISSTRINLTWSATPYITGYNVYRSDDGGVSYTKVYNGSALTYTDTGLTLGTQYRYRVSSYNDEIGRASCRERV